MTRLFTIVLLLAITLSSTSAVAQLKVIENGGTEDLSGTTITNHEVEIITEDYQFMETKLLVVNESDETLTLRCQRTELAVVAGTEHGVCWVFCPFPDLVSGDQPVYIVNTQSQGDLTETVLPGDTITSFSIHHVPNSQSGLASYQIDIIDEDGNSLTNFITDFDASALSIDELRANSSLTLAPNPAREFMNLTIEGINVPTNVIISDLLGQQVSSSIYTPQSNTERIDTSELRNGVYFLSVLAEGQVIRTSKFIVSH